MFHDQGIFSKIKTSVQVETIRGKTKDLRRFMRSNMFYEIAIEIDIEIVFSAVCPQSSLLR